MRKLLFSVPILLVLLLVPAIAHAAAGEDEIASIVRAIAQGILDGHYLAATAFCVSLLTTLARLAWGVGGLGGAAFLGVHSFAAALGAALVSGSPLSWGVVYAALVIGVSAAGGYSLLQPIARWLRPRVERSVPEPLRALLLALLRLADAKVPPASTRAATAPLTVALLLGLVMASSCATVRRAGAAGAAVGLDCQAASVQATVLEAGSLARAYVLSTISGSGSVDTTALRAAARDLRSDALRCAFAAALAGLAEAASSPPDPESPQSLGLQLDPAQLRAAVREIAESEWGIEGGVLVGGELL